MMCVQNQPLHEILAAILPAFAAGEIRQPRFACWQFHALDAAGAVVEVSWSGSWLQVAASLADGHVHGEVLPRVAWELLTANGILTSAAKFAIRPGRNDVEVVCDLYLDNALPADERPDPAAYLTGLLRGTIHDLAGAQDHLRGSVPARGSTVTPLPPPPPLDFVELCTAVHWTCHPRAAGRVVVPLEVRGHYVQAMIENLPFPRVFVDLPAPTSAVGRMAVGVLLLHAGGLVRLVRPVIRGTADPATVAFEIPLVASTVAGDLDRALGALSFVCGLAYREVAALGGSEELSRQYLAIRGLSTGSQKET